jgi:hypothetical protein
MISQSEWRKSSRSTSASNCVEVAWRKSSRSTNASNCVEVSITERVAVRDSKNAEGPTITFPRGAWSAFVGR